MSNWNGVGTPGNGQILFCKNTAERAAFIGECGNGTQWAVELERTGKIVSCPPAWFSPIKTPEQVEEEKTIKYAMDLLGLRESDNISTVKQCLAILYNEGLLHNQPKVKALHYETYLEICSDSYSYKEEYIKLSNPGYIIEAKDQHNESLTEDKQ